MAIDDNPTPITVGELVDFLLTLPRNMKVCCQRYSDMMYQEMPFVVKGIPHATYIEKLNHKQLTAIEIDIPLTEDYLYFKGN